MAQEQVTLDTMASWAQRKLKRKPKRVLCQPVTCGFSYEGGYGYPSSFAEVQFDCHPAHWLEIAFDLDWPDCVRRQRQELMAAIMEAAIDVMLTHLHPFVGCRLTLRSLGWDELHSSEVSLYRATSRALEDLVGRSELWRIE